MKVKLITLFVLLFNIIFLSMILFIVDSKEKVHFSLNGKEAYVNLNGEYEEPGYTFEVCKRKKCLDIKQNVDSTNNIDTSTIGSYKVFYIARYKENEYKIEREVIVKDLIPPTIELKSGEEIEICPSSEYKDPGYKATDNYDGDLTDKVQIEKEDNKITYTVEDSSGNITTVERTYKKTDTKPPTIKLKGSNTINLAVNEKYKEPGYVVEDNCDNDLTKNVTVEGTVDTSQEGTYKLKYTIKDSSGNKSTVERNVVVKKTYSFATDNPNEYAKKLTQYIKENNYNVSVGYVNLKNGHTYYYKENTVYFGASLVKAVDDLYIYEKTELNNNTKNLVKKAISVSDNNAHMNLVKIIGLDNLRAYGQSLGATHFLTNKTNLYYGDTTVMDQIAIWKKLYSVINNNPNGNELKNYFVNTYANHLLFDGIPTTMHKYGRTDPYYHDVGIVFAEDPYIIVILTKHGGSNYKQVIKDLSQKIYTYNQIDK